MNSTKLKLFFRERITTYKARRDKVYRYMVRHENKPDDIRSIKASDTLAELNNIVNDYLKLYYDYNCIDRYSL